MLEEFLRGLSVGFLVYVILLMFGIFYAIHHKWPNETGEQFGNLIMYIGVLAACVYWAVKFLFL